MMDEEKTIAREEDEEWTPAMLVVGNWDAVVGVSPARRGALSWSENRQSGAGASPSSHQIQGTQEARRSDLS